MSSGYIDTNVFIHAITHDEHSAECSAFLKALADGRVTAKLDPLVIHELTYALPRFAKQMRRAEVAAFINGVLKWPGIEADRDLLTDALTRWGKTEGLGFVDAYLAARVASEGQLVYSKNVRELTQQGVTVPAPLPK